MRVEHLALRFAAHATGVTSALVQVHDARGLADLVAGAGLDEPLPESARAALVALGTSLPDTFASRTAAVEEPYADASVGNVSWLTSDTDGHCESDSDFSCVLSGS